MENTNIKETNTKNKVLFTFREEFTDIVRNEINAILKNNNVDSVKFIGQDLGIIETQDTFTNISKTFIENPPIFIRHICPIDIELEIKDGNQNIEDIINKIEILINSIDKDETISVQTRIIDPNIEFKPFDINKALSDIFIKLNIEIDVKKPQQVISIVINDGKVFAGLSKSKENISDWAGGERRFAKEPEQISRSEFKLLEAIEIFNLNFKKKGEALDIGASPGGWTRVLRNKYNMRVIALDPADIDKSLVMDKKVKHIRLSAQKFLDLNVKNINNYQFDAVVNDMRIDTDASVNVMLELNIFLKKDALSIMTLKLPKKNIKKAIDISIEKLSKYYNIIGVRQLFHNRHEIIVIMRKK